MQLRLEEVRSGTFRLRKSFVDQCECTIAPADPRVDACKHFRCPHLNRTWRNRSSRLLELSDSRFRLAKFGHRPSAKRPALVQEFPKTVFLGEGDLRLSELAHGLSLASIVSERSRSPDSPAEAEG